MINSVKCTRFPYHSYFDFFFFFDSYKSYRYTAFLFLNFKLKLPNNTKNSEYSISNVITRVKLLDVICILLLSIDIIFHAFPKMYLHNNLF